MGYVISEHILDIICSVYILFFIIKSASIGCPTLRDPCPEDKHCDPHPGHPTLRDLCPEDRRRVKGLVEEVARLGSEKDKLEGEMSRERVALQGLLENLTNQQHRLVREKKDILEQEIAC